MPNHVTHRIVVTGTTDDVAALKRLVLRDKNYTHYPSQDEPKEFDFNQVSAMPEILHKVTFPVRFGPNNRFILNEYVPGDGTARFREWEASEEEQAEIDKYEEKDWYSWALNNWGTKWNSYHFHEMADEARYEFKFDTAWSPPVPVFDSLTSMFPSLSFNVAWFDEGWCHAGVGMIGSSNPGTSMEQLFCDANAEVHETVYGEPPIVYEEEEALTENQLRILTNFTCDNVAVNSDKRGYFTLSGTLYSDDPDLDDDELYALRQRRDFIMGRIMGS